MQDKVDGEYSVTTSAAGVEPFVVKPPVFKCNVCGKKSRLMWSEHTVNNMCETFKPFRYAPYKLGETYRICFPCFYKKMGVKP